ncbi:MAG: hypothetical protein GY877_13325 [Hyphomicrobium sp.]|nr:hypothetical protein [Hyphomicrobium sp.]
MTSFSGKPKAQVRKQAENRFIQQMETKMKNMTTQDFVDFTPQTEEEIRNAIDKLIDQVWYNRHMNLKFNIEQGVETVDPKIWHGALKAAETVRLIYDASELGPWTDFEWGMINGKLSALRWVRGGEWDDLDT